MNNKLMFSICLIGLTGVYSSSLAMTDYQKKDFRKYIEHNKDDKSLLREEIAELYSRKESYLKGKSSTREILDKTRNEAEKSILQELLRKDQHLINFVQDQIDIIEEAEVL